MEMFFDTLGEKGAMLLILGLFIGSFMLNKKGGGGSGSGGSNSGSSSSE